VTAIVTEIKSDKFSNSKVRQPDEDIESEILEVSGLQNTISRSLPSKVVGKSKYS